MRIYLNRHWINSVLIISFTLLYFRPASAQIDEASLMKKYHADSILIGKSANYIFYHHEKKDKWGMYRDGKQVLLPLYDSIIEIEVFTRITAAYYLLYRGENFIIIPVVDNNVNLYAPEITFSAYEYLYSELDGNSVVFKDCCTGWGRVSWFIDLNNQLHQISFDDFKYSSPSVIPDENEKQEFDYWFDYIKKNAGGFKVDRINPFSVLDKSWGAENLSGALLRSSKTKKWGISLGGGYLIEPIADSIEACYEQSKLFYFWKDGKMSTLHYSDSDLPAWWGDSVAVVKYSNADLEAAISDGEDEFFVAVKKNGKWARIDPSDGFLLSEFVYVTLKEVPTYYIDMEEEEELKEIIAIDLKEE